MGIRKTLTSIIVGGLRHVLGVVPVESLTQAESDDLRILARLYQIIDREPVFAAALEFVLSSSAEHFSRRQCSTLVRTILCCLLKETGRRFHGIGQADRAEEVFQVAAAVRPGNSDRIVACLLLAIAPLPPARGNGFAASRGSWQPWCRLPATLCSLLSMKPRWQQAMAGIWTKRMRWPGS